LGTVSAVQNVDKTYLKVAKNFGIKSPQILWKVIFPAAFPNIVTSISMAIGTAWIFLVSGEMIGAQSGLGYMIIDARNNLASADLIAAIIVIGIIGLLLDALVKFVARKVTAHWGGAS
jgi:NitT/TauT family transport system permease protein